MVRWHLSVRQLLIGTELLATREWAIAARLLTRASVRKLFSPAGLAWDARGNQLFIADFGNHCIRRSPHWCLPVSLSGLGVGYRFRF